jgi:hypothetical protein
MLSLAADPALHGFAAKQTALLYCVAPSRIGASTDERGTDGVATNARVSASPLRATVVRLTDRQN